MNDWKAILKADPTNWLLEEDNPSVRYFTLKNILDRQDDEKDVQIAKREIMQAGIVPDMLQRQREKGYLEAYPRFYTYKYKGLVWSLITLAELGAEATPHIKEQCEFLFDKSQERQDGGFSQNMAAKEGGRISEVIPCLTGNMVWSLIRFGYLDDPRLQKGIEWITRFMHFNDGVADDLQVPPYNHYEMCWGTHTCHMGVVKALKGLSAIPIERRTKEINDTIQKAIEFILLHHIYKRSHNLNRKSKPGWLKFGFPLMYQTDVLEILEILTGLGVKDSRMDDAISIVVEKQDDMGRWKAENTYNSDRLLIPISQVDTQNKWITLRAISVLKRYHNTNVLGGIHIDSN